MPATERLSIVHGDYRPGNFLFDEASGAITAILDWEMGRIGDPYEDLGYTLQRPGMGVIGDDGEMLIGGLLSESEFLELYEQYSGRAIDHKRLHYYRIMQARKCVNIIGTGVRAAAGGRMHMDMIGLWLAAVGYSFVAELRALLEKEI
jgi:aminoglycoside phosphotransferase (APT) family kinase protein